MAIRDLCLVPIIVLSMSLGLACNCSDSDVSKGEANATPSFASPWVFEEARFGYEHNGGISISLMHYNSGSELIDRIGFKNIDPERSDTLFLVYQPAGPLDLNYPTAYYYVLVGEDALGETYDVDSVFDKRSYLLLNCMTSNRLVGEFELRFQISKYDLGNPKYAPHIPDNFTIRSGHFNALKY